ncbi:hypothetical protein [uncultured Roseobacter sp.]|uniref:hypothetical protein n=1 Tax=uncultured Roseobacter sp. TaxID=114847 RepID=UPI00260D37E8|nr:hypothetical protein [uncultured Roseobacter sp.]
MYSDISLPVTCESGESVVRLLAGTDNAVDEKTILREEAGIAHDPAGKKNDGHCASLCQNVLSSGAVRFDEKWLSARFPIVSIMAGFMMLNIPTECATNADRAWVIISEGYA